MRRHRFLGVLGAVAATILGAEVATYALFGSHTKVNTLIDLLPPSSHCQAVCCSTDLKRTLPPSQHSSLDDALAAHYQTVYAEQDEIPYAAWVLECENDVCREVEIHGVCLLQWEPTTSGPFWFKATYSKWHGPGARTGVDETYVWGLFKWVEVSFEPRAWL